MCLRVLHAKACIVILLFLASANAFGATYVVTKTADTADGTCNADCSLREAIIAANVNAGDDIITLPAGNYVLDKTGAPENAANTGDLDIMVNGKVTINGAGSDTTVIDGNGTDRVFDLLYGANLDVNGTAIQNGFCNYANGGGIFVDHATLKLTACILKNNKVGNAASYSGGGIGAKDNSTVTIENCTISGNEATANIGGFAWFHVTTVNITNTTVDGNRAPASSGMQSHASSITITGSTFSNNGTDSSGCSVGALNYGTVNITNSTFSGNPSSGGGLCLTDSNTTIVNSTFDNDKILQYGLLANTGTLNLKNTIIANIGATVPGTDDCTNWNNSATVNVTNSIIESGNCNGTIVDDPMLSPLADNGGHTWTHALYEGSPAIDAGDLASAPANDQRGTARDAMPDIGAFEGFIPMPEAPGGDGGTYEPPFDGPSKWTVPGSDSDINAPGWKNRSSVLYGKNWGGKADVLAYTFTGSRLEINANTGPFYGKFKVYVDGIYVGEVNLSKTPYTDNQTVFTMFLGGGEHTVEIVPVSALPGVTVNITGFTIYR